MGTSNELQYAAKNIVNDSKEPIFKCRHIIALFGFLVFLLVSIHRTVMSVAIVAMVNNAGISHISETKSVSCPSLVKNATEEESFYVIKKDGEFVWSPQIQGYVLGSYFIGYVTPQLPGGILAERYGCKWFLVAASLITGLFTLLIPPFARFSVSAVIAAQVMRGLAQGLVQPCLAILISNWFPKQERGFLYAFMLSATSLGTAVVCIYTGYICELPGGWSYSFYITGITGILLSFCISLLVAESPNVHPRISKAELDFILSNQEGILCKKRPKRPWRSMLTSVPVYAFMIGHFGHLWAMSQFWTVQSTFLGTILHYPISENGIFTAAPFLVQFLANQTASWISLYLQKENIASVDFLRKFWTYQSGLGFSACLLGMYYAGCNGNLSVIFSIVSMAFIGAGTPGISVVATDMSPTFAGSTHALAGTFAHMSTFILPVIVGYLTDNEQTIEQWNKVFFISIAVVMVSKTIFILYGSAEVQPWNFVDESSQLNDDKQTEVCRKDGEKDENQEITRF